MNNTILQIRNGKDFKVLYNYSANPNLPKSKITNNYVFKNVIQKPCTKT